MNFFLHISLYIGHFVSDIFIKVEFVRLKGIHKIITITIEYVLHEHTKKKIF